MPPIIVRYCDTARQWQAWFQGNPCITYCGESSTQAVHRVLQGHGTPAGDIELRVDQDDGRASVTKATWWPPDLMLRCEHCNGNGEYIGLIQREPCTRCAGSGFVAG